MAKEIQLQLPNMEEGTKLQPAKSLEGTKLLYIVVQDDVQPGANVVEKPSYHRYTRPLLQSTLQLMGCKQRHALKISDLVFEVIKSEMVPKKPKRDRFMGLAPLAEIGKKEPKLLDSNGFKVDPKPLKKRSTETISRDKFLTVVCDALKQYQYLGPQQRADLMVACRVRERKTSVTVLLCGTSGCGKSTLASLLGHRLGITTVVSTDSVRHMMRGFVSEKENPLLWASTYHAGEYLDPIAVSEAYHKKKEAKQASLPIRTPSTGASTPTEFSNIAEHASTSNGDGPSTSHKGKGIDAEVTQSEKSAGSGKLEGADSLVSSKVMAVQGFKAQSEMVMDSLDRLITAWETKKESVVIEGVHLSLNFVMGLMKKHPSIIPFMVYIGNESKHMERFAVRAKYMTLDPTKNKYVKYIRNIRTIQDWLCQRADKHLVPKVNNTNVDKSVAAIHTTVFNCLRRREDGEPLLDAQTNTVKVVHQEYTKQYTASALGSKSMFQLIQRRGSSRNMMAIMNEDGTVAKAWPLLSVQVEKRPSASIFMDRGVGTPLYGPFSAGITAPVNLQFGTLGLSAWPSDKGGSSDYNSSATHTQAQAQAGNDEAVSGNLLRGASTASSGAEKERIEEAEVSGSDEEMEEEEEKAEKEGESSGSELEPVEEDEIEGSVDDGSGRSEGEEEFVEDDAYWEYDESSPTPRPPSTGKDKKASMLRLRSFDQASAGRGAPILRKSVSHTARAPSRRHSFKPTTQSTT